LAAAAWAVHLVRTAVVLEVDLAVLPPHRMVELERDVDEFISERVELVEPTVDDLAELVDAELPAPEVVEFDHRQLERMHVNRGSLGIQQYRVPPAEPLHRAPSYPEEPI